MLKSNPPTLLSRYHSVIRKASSWCVGVSRGLVGLALRFVCFKLLIWIVALQGCFWNPTKLGSNPPKLDRFTHTYTRRSYLNLSLALAFRLALLGVGFGLAWSPYD